MVEMEVLTLRLPDGIMSTKISLKQLMSIKTGITMVIFIYNTPIQNFIMTFLTLRTDMHINLVQL